MKEEGLRDIKPIDLPWLTPEQLLILIGLVILAFLLGKLFRKVSFKRKPNVHPPIQEPQIPPREWGLRRLDWLKNETTLTFDVNHLEIRKKFYFALSEILREFIERQYQVPAVERTTEELGPVLGSLKARGQLSTAHAAMIESCLLDFDRIKFTDEIPKESDPQEKWASVQSLVLACAEGPAERRAS